MIAAVAHADLPAELLLRHGAGEMGTLLRDYLPRCRSAGIRVLIGAIFVHPTYLPEQALSCAMGQIAALLSEIDRSGGAFRLVRTAGELDAALECRQIAIVLAMEGAEPLGKSPTLLRPFRDLGVRILGLTWNGRNAFADGCTLDGGLTEAGSALVREAWSLGMTVDVSHLSDRGLSDLLAMEGGAILASHSNCRALCDHPRNLTDGQLAALGQRGAVIGVNQIRDQARRSGSPGTLDDLCDHLLHIETMAGPGCACLGLDLARYYNQVFPRPQSYWDTHDPGEEDILSGYEALRQLRDRLLARGIPRETVRAMMGGNLPKFLRRTLPR